MLFGTAKEIITPIKPMRQACIGDYIDKYQPAWEKNDETDYYRAKLDDALAEAYGESLHDSFLERYEFAPEFDYMKGRWK